MACSGLDRRWGFESVYQLDELHTALRRPDLDLAGAIIEEEWRCLSVMRQRLGALGPGRPNMPVIVCLFSTCLKDTRDTCVHDGEDSRG